MRTQEVMEERERNLETCSQRGALRVASRKVESISDRILRSASVSSLGHLFPDEEDELPPNPPPSSAAAENLISSSILAGGLELIGEASSTTSLPPPAPCSISRFTSPDLNPPLFYSTHTHSLSHGFFIKPLTMEEEKEAALFLLQLGVRKER